MPGRERTDPGLYAEPTQADVALLLAALERTHPDEAETLRRAFALCESERFTYGLFRDVIAHMEQGTAARRDVAGALDRMRPAIERATAALEAEVEIKRRAQALAERAETTRHEEAVAGRTTALEHVKGAWAAVRTAAGNRVVIAGGFSVITLVATKLFEGLSAWWLSP